MTQNRNQGDNKNQINQGSSTRTDQTTQNKKMGSGMDDQSRKVASPTNQGGSSASASSSQNRSDQTRGGSSER